MHRDIQHIGQEGKLVIRDDPLPRLHAADGFLRNIESRQLQLYRQPLLG